MDGIKIFSATKAKDRAKLGEEATRWLEAQKEADPSFHVVDKVVTQSSDQEFHCISITLFYNTTRHQHAKTRPGPRK